MDVKVPINVPWITSEDRAAVGAVLDSGDLMSGKQVEMFERELSLYLQRKHVVCVNSGSAALQLAIRASSKPGDESGPLPAFGFVATPNAWLSAGIVFRQLFADGAASWLLGDTEVGSVGDGLLIRDACQCFGGKAKPPSLADCYSFNANKPICCIGGCVATDNLDLAWLVRSMRDQGRNPFSDGRAMWVGGNFKMPELNAALGRSQLLRIDLILSARQHITAQYAKLLPDSIVRPAPRESWFMYPIEVQQAGNVASYLRRHGVEVRDCLDWFLPAHPAFKQDPGGYPLAAAKAQRTLLLPCYPTMTEQQISLVCSTLADAGAKT